jgi:hypothetical protein
MTGWFTSRNGAVILGTVALVTELWRAFLDAMFVLPIDFGDAERMQAAAAIYTVLLVAWALSLAAAWQGSRRGTLVAFVLNAFALLAVPVSWLLFYCGADCAITAGILNLANTLNLFFGLLAAVALGLQLRKQARPEAYAGV